MKRFCAFVLIVFLAAAAASCGGGGGGGVFSGGDVVVYRSGARDYRVLWPVGDGRWYSVDLPYKSGEAGDGVGNRIGAFNVVYSYNNSIDTVVKDSFLPGSLSVYEYAFRCAPEGGGGAVWAGNAHGWDRQVSLTVFVDEKAASLEEEEAVSGKSVRISRVSRLYHPDYFAGTSPVCAVTLDYLFDGKGMRLARADEWKTRMIFEQGYSAMWPLDQKFDAAFNPAGFAQPETLRDDDNSEKAEGTSTEIYCWQSAGDFAARLRAEEPPEANLSVLDRADGLNKILVWSTSYRAGETVDPGETVLSSVGYTPLCFPEGADTALRKLYGL